MPDVIIRHPRSGLEYGIDSADFRRGKHFWDAKAGDFVSYADAGFRVVSLGNGEAYHGPLNDPPPERSQGEHSS
jgi:hypothetical protein